MDSSRSVLICIDYRTRVIDILPDISKVENINPFFSLLTFILWYEFWLYSKHLSMIVLIYKIISSKIHVPPYAGTNPNSTLCSSVCNLPRICSLAPVGESAIWLYPIHHPLVNVLMSYNLSKAQSPQWDETQPYFIQYYIYSNHRLNIKIIL